MILVEWVIYSSIKNLIYSTRMSLRYVKLGHGRTNSSGLEGPTLKNGPTSPLVIGRLGWPRGWLENRLESLLRPLVRVLEGMGDLG